MQDLSLQSVVHLEVGAVEFQTRQCQRWPARGEGGVVMAVIVRFNARAKYRLGTASSWSGSRCKVVKRIHSYDWEVLG